MKNFTREPPTPTAHRDGKLRKENESLGDGRKIDANPWWLLGGRHRKISHECSTFVRNGQNYRPHFYEKWTAFVREMRYRSSFSWNSKNVPKLDQALTLLFV